MFSLRRVLIVFGVVAALTAFVLIGPKWRAQEAVELARTTEPITLEPAVGAGAPRLGTNEAVKVSHETIEDFWNWFDTQQGMSELEKQRAIWKVGFKFEKEGKLGEFLASLPVAEYADDAVDYMSMNLPGEPEKWLAFTRELRESGANSKWARRFMLSATGRLASKYPDPVKGFEAFLDSDHSGSDFIVGVNNLYLNYHHLYDKDTGSAALSTVVERAPEATRLRLLESLDVANALVHTDWTKAIEFSAENPASHEQMGEALVEVSSETRESVADRLASDVGLEQMRDSFFQGWLGKEMNAALGWASGQELPLRDNLIELAYPMIKKNNSEAAGQWLEQISSPEVQARLKGS